MAKVASGGYDGKGTKIIRNLHQLEELITENNDEKWFIEKWVCYEKELSIVATRDAKGIVRSLPIAETSQSNQVCDWVIAPAHINQNVQLMAKNIASSLLAELDYVGVLTIEFFYGKDGLLVNEIAPRTHNSGHFSIEACSSSQFDQQICISSGIPVPMPEMIVPGALMVNLLGLPSSYPVSINSRLEALKNIPGVNLHWYEKNKEIPGRKLGHITLLLYGDDPLKRMEDALKGLERIRSIWPMNMG